MEDRSTLSCSSTWTGRSSSMTNSPNVLRHRRHNLWRNNPGQRRWLFRMKPWNFQPSHSMTIDRKFPGSCETATALSGILKGFRSGHHEGHPEGPMKQGLSLIFFIGAVGITGASSQVPPSPNLVHVATALDHLTVLEFHEPVAMAAAGSSDFQIERQED